jgi:hypothetical protein
MLELFISVNNLAICECFVRKVFGKPYAGNQLVRFDEGEQGRNAPLSTLLVYYYIKLINYVDK